MDTLFTKDDMKDDKYFQVETVNRRYGIIAFVFMKNQYLISDKIDLIGLIA